MDGESAIVKAILLGVVQGIAEFLPISSSGHLVIFGELINRAFGHQASDAENLHFNVALHFGTLLSILVVYRNEVLGLFRMPRLCAAIVVATIPAAVVGLSFKDELESAFSTPLLAGCCLLVTAALLAVGQRFGGNAKPLDEITQADALAVGLFQAVALLPGVSRSGSTISGGLLRGLRRESAAAFSFLIAIPVIGGATLLTAKDVWKASHDRETVAAASTLSARVDAADGEQTSVDAPGPSSNGTGATQADGADPLALAVGAVVSFFVGVLSLRWLMRLISQRRLHWFAWYCAAAGISTIVWQLAERAG